MEDIYSVVEDSTAKPKKSSVVLRFVKHIALRKLIRFVIKCGIVALYCLTFKAFGFYGYNWVVKITITLSAWWYGRVCYAYLKETMRKYGNDDEIELGTILRFLVELFK